jgi:hypothetical protein
MKLRFSTSLLLIIAIFFSSAVSVNASQDQQNSEDALREALNATAQELGLSARAQIINDGAGTGWALNPPMDPGKNTIIILNTDAMYQAWLALAETIGGSATPMSFYGFNAHSIVSILFLHNINGYYVTIQDSAETLAGAKKIGEIFLRHAAASGFIDGNGSDIKSETIMPELTLTPEPGNRISLRAYAENYDQDTYAIDNSTNFGSVAISGRVTDADTGAALEGAVVEITSGAASDSTLSAADGSYSLTAEVSGGEGGGQIQGIDFTLLYNTELSIEVTPSSSELLADGTSTSDIMIRVKDLQGNPIKDRVFDLELSADAGPGTIQPEQATTDENGLIQATYTAFKLEPGQGSTTPRHEVTITARDTATGLVGTNWIFVNQYQLAVQYGEYILACAQCKFPSTFTISVSDYWNNPIPNTPLTLRIEGGSSGGTLVLDPNSNTTQQEITLTTDSNGRATVYYKWQGRPDIAEAVQKVVILEGATNAQETKDVKVQGLDISLARVEEAGFTGVTGQQAFLKVYFNDRAHPDLPLDRFNADSPNKLGLRVTISQYHSDGVNTSLTYENYGGWEEGAGGFFVKMYDTPHMPYIIPVNDGSSWYEIRVDPVIDHDIDLPDLFRPNNDTILVLTTGSPDSWLHIWLQDGILTPHSWAGVVFKCVGRFLPGVGQAMTVIDTLNQVYKKDVLGLGQGTAQVLTDALEAKSTLLTPLNNTINLTRTAAFNNVISCMQDIYSVSKEGTTQGAAAGPGGVCASLPRPLQGLIPFTALDEDDTDMISIYQDRFAHGLLLDTPEERGIVIYGLGAGNVTLRDASGLVFEDPDKMNTDGYAVVYFLPVDEQFQLEVVSDHAFEIGVYQAGSDATNRKTFRHEIQTDIELAATMVINSSSDYALELDYNDDGVSDEILNAQSATLDVVKPQITGIYPEQNVTVSEIDTMIYASYTDNPGGVGIDPQSIRILVDGVDLTSNTSVQPETLSLPISDIGTGEHTIRLVVSDLDGNATISEWTFNVQPGSSSSTNIPNKAQNITSNLLIPISGGLISILVGGIILSLFYRRKQRQSGLQRPQQKFQTPGQAKPFQDEQGKWWYQELDTENWQFWDGQNWQAAQVGPENLPPPPPINQTISDKPKGKGCLFSIVVVGMMSVFIIGGVTLIALNFFPNVTLPLAASVSVDVLLKNGGGGILLTLLGSFLLRSGFNAIVTKRIIREDEANRKREKRGCTAVFIGFGLVTVGVILASAGLGLIALVLHQQLIPLLGYSFI